MTKPSTHTAQQLESAEKILGYHFKDRELLCRALTHPSAVEKADSLKSYERLEFLGDSIMGAVVAFLLYNRFPQMHEGGMTRIKVALVSGATLSEVAKKLGIGDLILFGPSEKGTRKRGLHSALENVFEAIVGAICEDGGVEAAREFVTRMLGPLISEDLAHEPDNAKSTLQELLQAHKITPTYELVGTTGPPHDRHFESQVLAGGEVIGHGSGRSKKVSEIAAARDALARLTAEDAAGSSATQADKTGQ
jgi:ribonuclease-3